ncbi:hypothetical protein BRC89_06770 [Halobacteriales archaeon QS_4_70_19]|nr:MAG: hypothetical protein BRC89_06770 [Halobacteriales archaeon QS_4_70_19]
MALSLDDLAGIADLFGGLTRAELGEALEELAFRKGVEPPPEAAVDGAVREYALVAYPRDGTGDDSESLLVPGPAAFPTLPDGVADLPHILDVESRAIDRDELGRAVEERFRGDVARAVADEDAELVERLLDVSYDLETWGPVDLGDLRERLDDAREG